MLDNHTRLDSMTPAQICRRLHAARDECDISIAEVRARMAALSRDTGQRLEQRQAELAIRRRDGTRDAIAELCTQIKALQDHADEKAKQAQRALRTLAARRRYIDTELAVYQRWAR